MSAGPFFAGERFSLVDAVFAPIFRYFDVFDDLIDLAIFAETPKVRAWRAALSKRPSVKGAVSPEYPKLLRAFLDRHNAHMLKLAAWPTAASKSTSGFSDTTRRVISKSDDILSTTEN